MFLNEGSNDEEGGDDDRKDHLFDNYWIIVDEEFLGRIIWSTTSVSLLMNIF